MRQAKLPAASHKVPITKEMPECSDQADAKDTVSV